MDLIGLNDRQREAVVTTDGQMLASSKKPIFCLSGGYYYTEEEGNFALIGYDGVISEGVHRPQGNLQVFDKESGKDARTLVINTKEYALPFGRGWDLGIGLVSGYSYEIQKTGVFNLFTGEQLLPYEYDRVYASGGLIYAVADTSCHVYRPCWQYM